MTDTQEPKEFEDAFFELVQTMEELRSSDGLNKLWERMQSGDAVSEAEVIEATLLRDHRVLLAIGKLRREPLARWGESQKIFSTPSKWDSVREKDYDRWKASPDARALIGASQTLDRQIYATWRTGLSAEKQSGEQ